MKKQETRYLSGRIPFVATFTFYLAMSLVSQKTGAGSLPITPEPPPRPRVLMDYYHHSEPQYKIGNLIVTGGFKDNLGRYGLDDIHHSNGFDPLVEAIERDYALIVHKEPFTRQTTQNADIIFIFTPDSKQLAPHIPLISDREIDDMEAFVMEGGTLLLMVNSYHATEKFDQVQLRKLFQRFGLDWNDDDTKYVDIAIGAGHPYFYDMDVFHYGAGCTIKVDPSVTAETLLAVYGDVGHKEVRGPGIVLVRRGEGKVIAVGDTGSWGGNMSRPWSENERFFVQLMAWCKRDTGIRPVRYQAGQDLKYKMSIVKVRIIPEKNQLSYLEQPGYEVHIPRKKTRIPYLEETVDVTLTGGIEGDNGLQKCMVVLNHYRHFDEDVALPDKAGLHIDLSRLGNIVDVQVDDAALLPFAADIGGLFAFLPNDAIRVGDRWEKRHPFHVLAVRGTDLGPTRNVNTQMCYVGDEDVAGRRCRRILTSAAVWLTDIGISAADIVPIEKVRRWSGPQYEFSGRGGRLLLKREQWVDAETSIVVQARTQQRVAVWMHDRDNPAGPDIADMDNKMIVCASQDVWFRLSDQ